MALDLLIQNHKTHLNNQKLHNLLHPKQKNTSLEAKPRWLRGQQAPRRPRLEPEPHVCVCLCVTPGDIPGDAQATKRSNHLSRMGVPVAILIYASKCK